MVVPLIENSALGQGVHKLTFAWEGERPAAGQFFMIKPVRTTVFLGRPVSVFWAKPLEFVVARKGAGTEAICAMRAGDEAELIGPLGNRFADFLPPHRTAASCIALVGGGIGVAPLYAFAGELARMGAPSMFFAGFKTGEEVFAREAGGAELTVITENGSLGAKGLVTDVLDPASYEAVFVCGPLPMLQAVYQKCAAHGIPCFVSMEKRMACGVGACLGCRIETIGTAETIGKNRGGKRCCKDGPVFDGGTIAW
jgi:NAD(P)H-flavin reductase